MTSDFYQQFPFHFGGGERSCVPPFQAPMNTLSLSNYNVCKDLPMQRPVELLYSSNPAKKIYTELADLNLAAREFQWARDTLSSSKDEYLHDMKLEMKSYLEGVFSNAKYAQSF